ncbi:hypothetical protein D9619_010068 [Psilocybe cf. subviscida]|uniref:F-box domain-containing protein n=1 Tax=Psilocybe cf. subviscida TaxID=2480587 RepID=A0A8H5F6D7_9AGAR|nr:hypothetical protein D9619_010068 [Psilocybe cf. subviscida]
MPHLRKVILDVEFLSQNVSKTTAQKTVELPRLSSLEVGGATLRQIEYILSYLTLPRLQHLEVCCIDQSASNNNYTSLMQVISKTLANGDFGTLGLLIITYYQFQLFSQRESSISTRLDFVLDGDDDNSYIIRDTLAGFSPQILAHLTDVDVTPCMPIPDQLFTLFFGSLPSLRSIYVDDDLTEAMIESLSIPTDRPSSTACIPFLFLSQSSRASSPGPPIEVEMPNYSLVSDEDEEDD